MADLFNQQISATYSGLLKTSSSGVLSASLSQISDGRGNTSPLYLSTDSIQFYGAYSFPSSDGSANQVLKTDGAGVLTWENDSLSNTLDFSGGTGTGSVTLDSQVLAFTGTANQIVTSASSQAITLSFPTAGVTLPDGSVATTQSPSNNSTKVATTAYVEAAVAAGGGGDVTKIDPITANQIAVWNDSTDELRSDETVTIGTDHSITLYQPNTNSITTNYIIGGGSSMTTGQQNTGFGSSVLTLNTTGVGNVAIGSDSLTTNVSGNNNVAIGLETLKRTTASDNIAIGSRVLQFDTTGYENTAIGGLSQSNITTAYGNTSLGYNSLIYNSTGIQNTAIGLNSLKGVSTYSASNNTAIGYNSGSAITTGSNNVIIGSNTGSTIATSSSNIIISDGSGTIRQSFDFTGAATFSTGANRTLIIGKDSVDTGYNVVSLNGTTTKGSYSGIAGGGTSDNNLYLNSANNVVVQTGSGFSPSLTISSGGDTTITTTTNQGGLTITSATDNTTLRLINTATSGQDWRLYSTGGSSGLGAGKLFIKVGTTETAARLVSFVDDGSNINVGIGTTSPAYLLTASGTNLPYIASVTANVQTVIASDETNGRAYIGTRTNHPIAFVVDGNEKMRISSGGDILLSSTEGKIGIKDSNSIYIGNFEGNNVGLRFIGVTNDIRPCTSSGDNQTDTIDLGDANARFKDFYLSGGVYLGGTSTANKLDAYEEGDWTNVFNTYSGITSFTDTYSRYTVIGNQVTLYYTFTINFTTANVRSTVTLNLPFSQRTNSSSIGGSVSCEQNTSPYRGSVGTIMDASYNDAGRCYIAFWPPVNGNHTVEGIIVYENTF